MTERPILFNGEMVRAILEGRKTQTRRPIPWKWAPTQSPNGHWSIYTGDGTRVMLVGAGPNEQLAMCQSMIAYGRMEIGDHLWARETYAHVTESDADIIWKRAWLYRATDPAYLPNRWHPSIHMPRCASRITLEVTDVRAERLQMIRTSDIIAEGISENDGYLGSANRFRHPFEDMWNSIYAKRGLGWDANPWVWAYTFKRVTP